MTWCMISHGIWRKAGASAQMFSTTSLSSSWLKTTHAQRHSQVKRSRRQQEGQLLTGWSSQSIIRLTNSQAANPLPRPEASAAQFIEQLCSSTALTKHGNLITGPCKDNLEVHGPYNLLSNYSYNPNMSPIATATVDLIGL